MLFLCWCQLFPCGLLLRLKRLPTIRSIALKASILIHTNVFRVCGVFFISDLFIVPFAFIGLAQIIHFPSMDAANNEILDRVRFFSRAAKLAGGSPPLAARDRRRDHGESADVGSAAGGGSLGPAAALARH